MKQFIKQAELDTMPLDPRARFVSIYELVNERFDAEVATIDGRNDWHLVEHARVRFAAAMIGFAQSLGIPEVANFDFSSIRNNEQGAFENFELSLAHVVAQFMTDNSLRANLDSIELRGDAKERLEKLASAMRSQVEKLDLSPARREALHRHIEAFERELRHTRLRLIAVAKLALGVSVAVGGLAQGAVAFLELHDRLVQTVAKEKEEQDQERAGHLFLICSPQAARPVRLLENQSREATPLPADLDDEIPF